MYSILSHVPSRTVVGRAVVLAAASLIIGATSLLSQTPAARPDSPAPAGRDVITESELLKRMHGAKQITDLKNNLEAAPPEAKPDLTPSLYKRSIILFDGESHTVVPLGAVLHLPPSHRSRIIEKPKGDFLFWPAFVEKNKSWVGGWEVPMEMARGNAELAQNVMRQTAQDSRVLVAVYKGGPITILEAVPDKSSQTSGTKK